MPPPRAVPATSSTACSATTTRRLPPPSADLGAPSGTFRTVCVRTCDGAYFPVSFATYQARFQDDERTCKALCPATEATLFTYRNPGEDINQAVSINGQPYTSLPNAFKFRTEFNPSCSCKAAGQTWSDALKSVDDKAGVEQGDIIVTEESAKRMQQRAQPKGATPPPKKGAAAQRHRRRSRLAERPPPARTCHARPDFTATALGLTRTVPEPRRACIPREQRAMVRLTRDLEDASKPTDAAGARHQVLVGLRQRLAVVAKTVGDGIAAVAAKVLFGHLDAGRGLPALVFGDVEQAVDPRHHVGGETVRDDRRPAASRARPAARGCRRACRRAAANPGRSGSRATRPSAAG